MIEIFEPLINTFKLMISFWKISPVMMTIFYSWVLYMNIGIMIYNKPMIELVTFGFIKKGVSA